MASLIDVPKGSSSGDRIFITEHRWNSLGEFDNRSVIAPSLNDPALRVLIDRGRWLALAPGVLGGSKQATSREWLGGGEIFQPFQTRPCSRVAG